MTRQQFNAHSFQADGIRHIKQTPRCALWMGLGCGKTICTLTALKELRDEGMGGMTLILAPLRVARSVWTTETDKWEHLEGYKVFSLVAKTPAQRVKLWAKAKAEGYDAVAINYEAIPAFLKLLGGAWPFTTVVADEGSKLKSLRPRQGGQRAHLIYQASKTTPRFIELSGTPASKGLESLFGQIYALDHGARLGKTYSAFTDTYFNAFALSQYVNLYTPKKGALDAAMLKLRDVCLTIRSEDVFDIKAPHYVPVYVDMPPDARIAYRELATEYITEVQNNGIMAPNSAVLSGKLLQAASGTLYTEAGETVELHTEKLDALESIIEELAGAPLLVVYHYKADLIRLQKRFPQARVLKTTADEVAWNKGEIPVLLIHPDSAGHGLNLQFGGHHMAFFTVGFSLETYQQVRERIGPVRQLQAGFNRVVVEYYILARDSMDDIAMSKMQGKAMTQDEILKAVRR